MARHLPQKPFPPYSYVSGKYPHPHREPAGHSYGMLVDESVLLTESAWQQCESYLWGIDLLNGGFYWEAHEAWEQAWIRVGRKGPIADFLKALIKLAAAGVKAREGRSAGVRRHAQRSLELLNIPALQQRDGFLGLNLNQLRPAMRSIAEQAADITRQATEHDQSHTLPVQLNLH